jgi:hypothetical protein
MPIDENLFEILPDGRYLGDGLQRKIFPYNHNRQHFRTSSFYAVRNLS